MTKEVERLLGDSGWLPEPLRLTDGDRARRPDHWRHVHNRLTAGKQPCQYTLARHKAWLMRRSVAP